VKLVKKTRVGSKLRRVYDAAQTPLQRVLASGQADPTRVAELQKLRLALNLFQLGERIDQKLQEIYDMANPRLSSKAAVPSQSRTKSCKNRSFDGAAGEKGPQTPVPFPQTAIPGPLVWPVTFEMSRQH
jgi:hypothetical protein